MLKVCLKWYFLLFLIQVDLTEYLEKHEFVFDSVLDEDVSNVEVIYKVQKKIICSLLICTFFLCRCTMKLWSLLFLLSFSEQKPLVLHMDKQARLYILELSVFYCFLMYLKSE